MKYTPAEKIARLEAQRKAIMLKISLAVRAEEERAAKENSGNRNRIGLLAEEAGIAAMTDDEFKALFASAKAKRPVVGVAVPVA